MSAALLEAEHFLSPVLDRTRLSPGAQAQNLTLLERLAPAAPTSTPVLPHALHLLRSICASPTATGTDPVSATSARTLNALIDLLVLEGIYPSLSAGVGVPLSRRARNFVLPPTRGGRRVVEGRRDVALLEQLVDGLVGVLAARTVRERCLVDVLAGCGELAFMDGGGGGGSGGEEWERKWWGVVDSTPTPSLLPALLSLLHPATPPAFRTALTRALSTLPMTRPHAVRHILELFLSTASDAALSLDALSNASRIIGAVPAAVGPADYFGRVCPQLLELLDGKDAGLARAAAYVLAELLGRKGPVEAVVEREVVDKIVAGMVPPPEPEPVPIGPADRSAGRETSSVLLAFEDTPPPPPPTARFPLVQEVPDDPTPANDTPGSDKPLIPEPTLSRTLTRLSTLLTAHPSPSVPHRLLTPLLQPLWALAIYALTTSRSTWHARALALLRTHVKTSPAPCALLTQLHGRLHCAPAAALGPGEAGGIEVRRGPAAQLPVDEVDVRVHAFVELLGEAPDEAVAEFFLGLLRTWLGGAAAQEEAGREGAMRMLATMKVLREVLGRYGGALAKSPTQTLQIVGGVLGEYRLWKEATAGSRAGREEDMGPSLGGLGRIVVDAPPPLRRRRREEEGEGEEGEEDEDEDLDEETSRAQTVTLALSLLSVLVSSPDTKLTAADERLLQTLHPDLTFLTTAPSVPSDVSSFSLNILSLLTLHTPAGGTSGPASSLHQQQKETHALALSYLRDPLIPVRAHGLHLLRTLILASSPTIDVPATASLLMATLADADSYVYLNAVKALTALSDRHARTVIRILIDAYVDVPEARSLDERLRLGEALLAAVQRQGAALAGHPAESLGTAMLGVVSRRKTRGVASGGGGEEWGDEDEDENENEDESAGERRRRAARYNAAIVGGWGGDGRTEDVRIRASALSVLGAAVEAGAAGLGARVLGEAVDVAVMVLTLEAGVQFAILRRAAVVCIGGVLRALVSQGGDEGDGDGWRAAVWEALGGRVKDVGRVLAYIAATDNDGLVREQAGVVGGNLEAVVERRMVGGRRIVEVGGGGVGTVRVVE